MYTYKFEGLRQEDSPTRYYYGSLPAKAEPGQRLFYDQTENWYLVLRVEGEGVPGADNAADYQNQTDMAWAEINRGEQVPTILLDGGASWKDGDGGPTIRPTGRSFDPDHLKEYSQSNRHARFAKSGS